MRKAYRNFRGELETEWGVSLKESVTVLAVGDEVRVTNADPPYVGHVRKIHAIRMRARRTTKGISRRWHALITVEPT